MGHGWEGSRVLQRSDYGKRCSELRLGQGAAHQNILEGTGLLRREKPLYLSGRASFLRCSYLQDFDVRPGTDHRGSPRESIPVHALLAARRWHLGWGQVRLLRGGLNGCHTLLQVPWEVSSQALGHTSWTRAWFTDNTISC